MMDVCTLGTGGAIPLPERALSSLDVRVDGHCLLIDCGEGTQVQLRKLGWGFKCVDAILLTHYHADHCGGLPGFLLSMTKAERREVLHLYGPPGLRRVVEALCVIAPALSFPIALHELPLQESSFSVAGLEVTAFPLNHGIPCLGYCLSLHRAPVFQPERARALAVPVQLWSRLQRGETVEVEGRAVCPEQVMGAPRRGLKLLYATDTRPVEAIPRLGRAADLMILEGMYGDEDKRPQAIKNHHMLFREAAAMARESGAKRLLLTHLSNCIDDPEPFLPLAQAVFPETEVAQDGMALTLRYPEN